MEHIETKRKLIKWIKDQSDCFIYTDSKQSGADGTFMVKGTLGSKPDLLITKLIDGHKWNIAVEVKPGQSSKLTDAMFQCIKYAGQYVNEDANYVVDGEILHIHDFVVATDNSDLGFLYDKESFLGPESFVKGEFISITEKPMTYLYWRIMLRLWKEEVKNYLNKTELLNTKPPRVGILVSELIEDFRGVRNTNLPVIITDNSMKKLY